MAVLRMELHIDSDVHPELHAMLSAIGSDPSRAERLRQLASTGLVWESLRLLAYPTAGFGPALRGDEPPGADAAPAARGAPPARPAVATERLRATEPLRTAESARASAPAVPELRDVVEENQLPRPARARPSAATSPIRRAAASRSAADADAFPHGDLLTVESAGETRPTPAWPAESVVPEASPYSPPARTSGSRSRLLRMKEKGLFSNG